MSADAPFVTGRCTCGDVAYALHDKPLFVHCCHCTWCQRETGSAFAVNVIIEADRFSLIEGEADAHVIPSASGKGQQLNRCPNCRVVLWSHYMGMGDRFHFVRAGTLDHPERTPPDIHIYTSTRQPWVTLPDDLPVMPEYYRRSEQWPAASVARFKASRGTE